MMLPLTLLAIPAAAAAAASVPLVSFNDAGGNTHTFKTLNDPVMGGKSSGTWQVANGVGVFEGDVNVVPSLHAPGFIEVWANDGGFADASSAMGGDLVLTVRSDTPEYGGFRVSIAAGALSTTFSCAAGGSIIGSRGCFKASFSVPPTKAGEFATVRVPFASFTDKWSSYTGEPTTTCADDKSVCVTAAKLAKIEAFGLWGEGKAGHVHLELKAVAAEPKTALLRGALVALATAAADEAEAAGAAGAEGAAAPARPPKKFDQCSAAVQSGLRYNISSLGNDALTAPVAVNPDESLAAAICCDKRTTPYAEPRFLFQSPFIALYDHMAAKGPTTFYDSVCGLPLFRAPLNRTLAEFKADTDEHGWPSFRPAEIIAENVITHKDTSFVYSKCGTHLGSFLPDDKGDRWCLDLSCLAGNPPTAPTSAM